MSLTAESHEQAAAGTGDEEGRGRAGTLVISAILSSRAEIIRSFCANAIDCRLFVSTWQAILD